MVLPRRERLQLRRNPKFTTEQLEYALKINYRQAKNQIIKKIQEKIPWLQSDFNNQQFCNRNINSE